MKQGESDLTTDWEALPTGAIARGCLLKQPEKTELRQLKLGRLLTWPADQPRHAICTSAIRSKPVRPRSVLFGCFCLGALFYGLGSDLPVSHRRLPAVGSMILPSARCILAGRPSRCRKPRGIYRSCRAKIPIFLQKIACQASPRHFPRAILARWRIRPPPCPPPHQILTLSQCHPYDL